MILLKYLFAFGWAALREIKARSIVINDGRWHQIVSVFESHPVDGLNQKVYVDGLLMIAKPREVSIEWTSMLPELDGIGKTRRGSAGAWIKTNARKPPPAPLYVADSSAMRIPTKIEGRMDQLFVTEDALSSYQISRLFALRYARRWRRVLRRWRKRLRQDGTPVPVVVAPRKRRGRMLTAEDFTANPIKLYNLGEPNA